MSLRFSHLCFGALLSFAVSAEPAGAQSDSASFDSVISYPTVVLGNVVNGPIAGATLPVLDETTQFNFNFGSSSASNTVEGFGNEVNARFGSTLDNFTLGFGSTLNLLGGNLVNGLTVNSPNVFNPSQVNLIAGGISGDVEISGTTQAVIQTGGGIPLTLSGQPEVQIRTGANISTLHAPDAAQVTVTGGTIGTVTTANSSRLTVTGGNFTGAVGITNDVFANISGGDFSEIDVDILNDMNIAGGAIESFEVTSVSATVNISGGEFGDSTFLAGFDAEVNITGGNFGDDIQISDDAVVTIAGGSFSANIDVDDRATLNLVGTQFLVDGADVTSDVAAAGLAGLAINSVSPPMLIEVELVDGSSVAFAFQAESVQLAEEVSTLDANATVNLIVGTAPVAGDFNADGTVDLADYTVWRDHLGERGESSLAFNGDGLNGVDIADYELWRENYSGPSAGTGAAPVPEPTASWLALAAVLGSFRCRGCLAR